jgi:hypothetical protein
MIRGPKLINFIGWYSQLPQIIRRAGAEFRNNLDLLLAQNSVNLVMVKHFDFSRCLTPFFCCLVGL